MKICFLVVLLKSQSSNREKEFCLHAFGELLYIAGIAHIHSI